jgi:hypothetical protein
MSTLEEMMAEDSGDSTGPSDDQLVEITTLVDKLLYWEDWITKLEEKLVVAKANWQQIAEKQLPSALQEAGISEYKMVDGRRVASKQHIYASIPEARVNEAFQWLRDNDLDGVIKNVVMVDFVKGEDERVAELIKLIAEAGMQPQRKQTVHPQTLKALIREQREKGVDVPLDVFGAHVVTRAEVKK